MRSLSRTEPNFVLTTSTVDAQPLTTTTPLYHAVYYQGGDSERRDDLRQALASRIAAICYLEMASAFGSNLRITPDTSNLYRYSLALQLLLELFFRRNELLRWPSRTPKSCDREMFNGPDP